MLENAPAGIVPLSALPTTDKPFKEEMFHIGGGMSPERLLNWNESKERRGIRPKDEGMAPDSVVPKVECLERRQVGYRRRNLPRQVVGEQVEAL